jgi:curli biogenesis system outer membrane secretion channel CsgG
MKIIKNLLLLALLIAFSLPSSNAQGRKNNKNEVNYEALLTLIKNYTPNGNEKTILILDFENDTFFDSDRLGKAVSHMFETIISSSQRVKLVDRSMIIQNTNSYDVMQINLEDKIQKAKALGVEFIINGCVTEFGIKKTGTSVKASANVDENGSKIGTGLSFERGKGTARVTADIKIIDVNSMQTVYSNSSIGKPPFQQVQ